MTKMLCILLCNLKGSGKASGTVPPESSRLIDACFNLAKDV